MEKVVKYKRCSKCERIFKNYEKPNTCIFCGSSKSVKEVVFKVPESRNSGER